MASTLNSYNLWISFSQVIVVGLNTQRFSYKESSRGIYGHFLRFKNPKTVIIQTEPNIEQLGYYTYKNN